MKIDELKMEPVYQYTIVGKINELVRAHNTKELAATDSQQLKPKMPLLEECLSVIPLPSNEREAAMVVAGITDCYNYISWHFGH